MNLFITIISYVIIGISIFVLYHSYSVQKDVERSVRNLKAIKYPLYEEKQDKLIFYQRKKYYTLHFILIIGLIASILTMLNGITSSLWIFYYLLPANILYGLLWFYHSFFRLEIDEQGIVRIYNISNRKIPITIISKRGTLMKISHRKKHGDYKYSYYLCCEGEQMLLFETKIELGEQSIQLLKDILPKYNLQLNPIILDENALWL